MPVPAFSRDCKHLSRCSPHFLNAALLQEVLRPAELVLLIGDQIGHFLSLRLLPGERDIKCKHSAIYLIYLRILFQFLVYFIFNGAGIVGAHQGKIRTPGTQRPHRMMHEINNS